MGFNPTKTSLLKPHHRWAQAWGNALYMELGAGMVGLSQVGSWPLPVAFGDAWAALPSPCQGSPLTPKLEGSLLVLLAYPQLGQYDLALPFTSGQPTPPQQYQTAKVCSPSPCSVDTELKEDTMSFSDNILVFKKTMAKYFQPALSTQFAQASQPRTCISAPVADGMSR